MSSIAVQMASKQTIQLLNCNQNFVSKFNPHREHSWAYIFFYIFNFKHVKNVEQSISSEINKWAYIFPYYASRKEKFIKAKLNIEGKSILVWFWSLQKN